MMVQCGGKPDDESGVMKIHNPKLLTRDLDGSCRLRLRFTEEDATAIEESARQANMPVLRWIYYTLCEGEQVPPRLPTQYQAQ
jgi:hypothetical protein